MQHTTACSDCVVSVLFGQGPIELAPEEAEAIEHLADGGLVPRLRLVSRNRRAG